MSLIGLQCVDKDGAEFEARVRYRAIFLERGKDVLVAFSIVPLQTTLDDLIPTSDIAQGYGAVEEKPSPEQSPHAHVIKVRSDLKIQWSRLTITPDSNLLVL